MTRDRQGIAELLAAPDLEIIGGQDGGRSSGRCQAAVSGWHRRPSCSWMASAPLQLVEEIQNQLSPHVPPIILVVTRPLDRRRKSRTWRALIANQRGEARPYAGALLDESVLLLHRDEADLTEEQRGILEQLRKTDPTLAGKTVLVVDDDVRNIFALTSLLEEHNLNVVHAENGRAGIELLKSRPGYRSGADGYHDAGDGWLRNHERHPADSGIPVASDRRSDGQSDEGRPREVHRGGRLGLHYEAVDLEQLFSVLRVWMGTQPSRSRVRWSLRECRNCVAMIGTAVAQENPATRRATRARTR